MGLFKLSALVLWYAAHMSKGKRQPQGVLKCVQVLPARTIGFGASMTTSLSREIWSSEHCFWTCHFRRILRHYSHNTSNLHENRWRQGWLFWHASGSSAHLVQMKPIVYTNLSNNMNITNSHPYIDTVFACISRKSFGFNLNCRCWTYSVQISSVIPHCSDWLRTDFPWWTMIPKLLGNRTHYNHQPIVVLNHLQLILPRPATAYITHKGSGGTSFFSSPSPAPQGMIKLHRIDAPTMEIVTASYNKYIDINHKSLWINEC